jgi:hypothetical protein
VTYWPVGEPRPADTDLRVPAPADYLRHAPLLVADLVGASGRRLDRYLDLAFTEIAQSEAMEMP